MRRLLYMFALAALIACQTACDGKGDEAVFDIVGDKTFQIGKEGGIISVIVISTLDYTITPEKNWGGVIEKKMTGFKINIVGNEEIIPRENKIVIQANGFEPITLTVNQEAGELFFTVEEDQKTKIFPKEGGTQTVTVSTNLTQYDAVPSEEWCEVTDKTPTGFKIMLGTNQSFRRQAQVTVSADGMEPITVNVAQSGDAILKNPNFASGFDNWTQKGSTGMFSLNSWMPNGLTGQSLAIAAEYWGVACEGNVVQTVTGLPDGTYTLSCVIAGGGTNGELALIAIDKDGKETKQIVSDEWGDWSRRSMTVEVSGGECSVGMYFKRNADTNGAVWFNFSGFVFE